MRAMWEILHRPLTEREESKEDHDELVDERERRRARRRLHLLDLRRDRLRRRRVRDLDTRATLPPRSPGSSSPKENAMSEAASTSEYGTSSNQGGRLRVPWDASDDAPKVDLTTVPLCLEHFAMGLWNLGTLVPDDHESTTHADRHAEWKLGADDDAPPSPPLAAFADSRHASFNVATIASNIAGSSSVRKIIGNVSGSRCLR